jgi:hypothetical protein
MYERCPVCGFVYGREPGYFTGAMYASYVLAVPLLALLALLVWAVTRWQVEWVLVVACLIFLLFVPAIFHFDRWIEPDD